jgi:hypothetical protein
MKVRISNRRRATYYKHGDKIPLKYRGDNYHFVKGRLTNMDTKKPIIRNANTAGKPRFVPIAGNALYTGLHERIRIAIITGIKSAFVPYLPKHLVGEVLTYPVHVNMAVYRTIGEGDWDIDNFVILYFKAFHDLLKDEGKIPDDSIRYISGTSSVFYPVNNESAHKLVFTLTSDVRLEIKSQLFYDDTIYPIVYGTAKWTILISDKADAGELMIDYDACAFIVGIGKKHVLWNAVRKVLNGIARYAIILNTDIEVSVEMAEMFNDLLVEKLSNESIQVKINPDTKTSEWTLNLFKNTKNSDYE